MIVVAAVTLSGTTMLFVGMIVSAGAFLVGVLLAAAVICVIMAAVAGRAVVCLL